MRNRMLMGLIAALGLGLGASACAHGYVAASVGPMPECPYGFYDLAPYNCAPMGYYGPEWFVNGAFIGAGPWFHGPRRFNGDVDNHYHPDHGYRGPTPARGERRQDGWTPNRANFHGNEKRDGRGHVVQRR